MPGCSRSDDGNDLGGLEIALARVGAMKGLAVPEPTEDFTADPVELFFDLAFVFAFSQLVHLLIVHPDWERVGEAALIFLLLWLPWTQFTVVRQCRAGESAIRSPGLSRRDRRQRADGGRRGDGLRRERSAVRRAVGRGPSHGARCDAHRGRDRDE